MPESAFFEGQPVQPVRDVARHSDTTNNIVSAATTNATSVKASPGKIYSLNLHNYNAAARTFKLYDKAEAPTVGTDVPSVQVTIAAAGDAHLTWPNGLDFNAGIAYAMTTEATITGTTAVGANDIVGKLAWS